MLIIKKYSIINYASSGLNFDNDSIGITLISDVDDLFLP